MFSTTQFFGNIPLCTTPASVHSFHSSSAAVTIGVHLDFVMCNDTDTGRNSGAVQSTLNPSTGRPPISSAEPEYPPLSAEEEAVHALENNQAVYQAENLTDADNYSDSSGPSNTFSDTGYDTDSVKSAGTSMTPGSRAWSFENGRRYHAFREGQYNFPNDETEQDREDIKHAMMVKLCQVLHFAPIGTSPQRVLDMGTGTGIWAIDSELCRDGSWPTARD
jgi:hypothetical protein